MASSQLVICPKCYKNIADREHMKDNSCSVCGPKLKEISSSIDCANNDWIDLVGEFLDNVRYSTDYSMKGNRILAKQFQQLILTMPINEIK